MQQIGYSLVNIENSEIQYWGDTAGQIQGVPNVIRLPSGDDVCCPLVGGEYQGTQLVERWLQIGGAESISFDGSKVIVTRLPPTVVVPQTISDRQFFQQLAVQGIISEADALASNAAVIPPPLLAIIEEMPAEEQFAAKMLVSGATVFQRNHAMTLAIGTAYGWTSEQIDAFFIAAAAL